MKKIGENWIYNGGKVVVYGEGSVGRREKEEEIKNHKSYTFYAFKASVAHILCQLSKKCQKWHK